MKAIEKENIRQLKSKVEELIGYQVSYAKNCDSLSEFIFERTNKKISSSTLKRFWGIIKHKFKPSKYTLDTLSSLLACEDWKHFCELKQERTLNESFLLLHRKFKDISMANILFLKKKTPAFYYKISQRKFASEKLDSFLKSSKKATSFIAHDGFGKSEILIRLAEDFFLSKKATFPNDLCLFINFETLNTASPENFDIYKLLKKILKEEDNTELESKFIKLLEGKRLVIFFDKICKIYKNDTIFPVIVKNMYSLFIGKLSKIDAKIIITCKASHWPIFEREFSQSDFLKNKWYDVNFNDKNKINIPILSRTEIINIIKGEKKELNYSYILGNNKLLDIISTPYFLDIYISNFTNKRNSISDELDLLNYYITEKILGSHDAKEKQIIIEKILDSTFFGREKVVVEKSALNLSISENKVYDDLLQFDFLSETISVTDYFEVTTQVSFSNAIIFKFVIINSWLRKHGLTLDTIRGMLNFYSTNEQMQISLLVWIIKIASKKNDISIFTHIFSIINEYFIKGNPRKLENRKINKMTDTVGIELRKNIFLRKKLLPIYSKSILASDLYFRYFLDLDFLVIYYAENSSYFLEGKTSKNDRIFSNAILFLEKYLSKKIEFSENYIQQIKEISEKSKNKIYKMIYQSCFIIYSYAQNIEIELDFIINLYNSFSKFETYTNKFEKNFLHFLVLEALEISNNTVLIIEIVNSRISDNENFRKKNNYLLNFLNIFKAKALVLESEEEKAFELLKNIDSRKFPEGQKLYWKIKYNFASAEYFQRKGMHENANKMIREINKIAKTLQYKVYFNKSEEINASGFGLE